MIPKVLTDHMPQPVDRISSFANGIRQISAYFWLLQSLGPVSRKSRKLFGSEKPFVKLRPAYSVKLVFSYVVKGIKIKIIAKFRASRRLRFEDTKRYMSPEMRPKMFGTFEKRAQASSTDPSSKSKTTIEPVFISRKLINENLKVREVKPATVPQQFLVQSFQCNASMQDMLVILAATPTNALIDTNKNRHQFVNII